jgi:hypothetical protein
MFFLELGESFWIHLVVTDGDVIFICAISAIKVYISKSK